MGRLAYQFGEGYRESPVLRRVMMVGAVPGSDYKLGDTDLLLLSRVARNLQTLKIPVASALKNCAMRPLDHAVNVDLDVVNILPEFGGRDFLEDEATTDLLIFCNIPDYSFEFNRIDSYTMLRYERLRRAFMVSAHHENHDAWRRRIDESGAKVVFIEGLDSFSPQQIKSDNYMSFQGEHCLNGLLIRTDYFESIAPDLIRGGSVLSEAYEDRIQNPWHQDFSLYAHGHAVRPVLAPIRP